MWKTKLFKKPETLRKWVEKNKHNYQMVIIFVHNAYGLEYRPLKKIVWQD